jgi:hypothetical protein
MKEHPRDIQETSLRKRNVPDSFLLNLTPSDTGQRLHPSRLNYMDVKIGNIKWSLFTCLGNQSMLGYVWGESMSTLTGLCGV